MPNHPAPPSDVAVVITARDAEAFIADAIRSAVAQTVPPVEIVVVDDGCRDATTAIAEAASPLVRVLPNAGEGMADGRTTGIAASTAPWVALLDADDVWLPTKLARQLVAAGEAPDPARIGVFCLADEFLDGAPDGVRTPRVGVEAVLPSAALLPRPLLDELGPFPRSATSDWIEWWSRARAADVEEVVVPEVLLRRRLHGANTSLTVSHGRELLDVVRAHLERRRTTS